MTIEQAKKAKKLTGYLDDAERVLTKLTENNPEEISSYFLDSTGNQTGFILQGDIISVIKESIEDYIKKVKLEIEQL